MNLKIEYLMELPTGELETLEQEAWEEYKRIKVVLEAKRLYEAEEDD